MSDRAKNKKPFIDDDFGINFMSGWSPLARWASVIPVTFLAFIFFKFTIGTISILFEHTLPLSLANYLSAILIYVIYLFTVQMGGAAAPTGSRTKVAATLAVLISVGFVALMFSAWTHVEGHDAIILIIQSLAAVLGCATAVLPFIRKNGAVPTEAK
jgi:hypothetical protein